ncbi:MAG: Xaa-Pro dipeptidyl-peptidase [Bacteroidota bacterium]
MHKLLNTLVITTTVFFLSSQGMQAQKKAAPVFVDGMTQIVPEFQDPANWIVHDLWVETEFDSDGDGKMDRMHVDVTRPKQTETEGLKLPVIYESSPYFAGTGTGDLQYFWNPRQELNNQPQPRKRFPPIKIRINRPVISKDFVEQWVPRGYIVVHSSSPGTGLSQGCPTVGGDNESLAPKAVIDWLNGRAKGYTTPEGNEEVKAYWTTGKVGMTGTSYNGTLPLAAATTGVDGLEVIIPVSPNTSYYHYYRTNGLIRHPGGWLGEDIDVLYDFIHSNPEHCAWCDSVIRDKEMVGHHDRVNGDYNDFWAGRDYLNDLGPMKAALLMAHGFNDWNVVPEHSYRIYDAVRAKGLPCKIYYHQGGHGGEPPFGMMNKWFAHFLHGVENDALEGPKAWIVRENDKNDQPTPYADYPNPEARPVSFYLTAGAPKTGTLVTERKADQGKETLVDNVSFSGSVLAQAEWTNHRLLYLTPVLKEPVHLSGISTITIRLACSKPAANLSVWMVALPWTNNREGKITDNIINRGWADPQNYRSLTKSEPLKPGKFYEITFNLQPDDQIIPAGKQIGLMIFSSDRDFTLWPEPGTELTVDLDGTSLVMPVVGGTDAWGRAVGK